MKPSEIVKRFEAAGWKQVGGGNHAIAVESPTGQRLPISNHPAHDVSIGVIKKLERLSGVKLR